MFEQLVRNAYTCILASHVVVLSSVYSSRCLEGTSVVSGCFGNFCTYVLLTQFFSVFLITDNGEFL